jgi:hypothetical protein
MEELLENKEDIHEKDLKEIIDYYTNDVNKQFSEIIKNINITYQLYKKNQIKNNICNLNFNIYINSKDSDINDLGKKMNFKEHLYLYCSAYIRRYYKNYTELICSCGNDGYKYLFWDELSNKILLRMITKIKNSYLDIYQKLPYTMEIDFYDELLLNIKDYSTDISEYGFCHYIKFYVKLDFTNNIFKQENIDTLFESEQNKKTEKKKKLFCFNINKSEKIYPIYPNFKYSPLVSNEDIYIEMKKLL